MGNINVQVTEAPDPTCLNPVGPCLDLGFQVSGLVELQGSPATIEIPADCILPASGLMEMTINGVTIYLTLDASDNPDCNEVTMNGRPANLTLFQALATARDTIDLFGAYNLASTPTGVLLNGLECDRDFTITFNYNEFTNVPDKTLFAEAQRVELVDNFQIALNLSGCGLEDVEVCLEPDHLIAGDCVYIFSRLNKDLNCFYSNLNNFEGVPNCDVAVSVFQVAQSQGLCTPQIYYSLRYGDPINTFRREQIPPFRVFQGTTKPDGWPNWDDYIGCNAMAAQQFNLYSDGHVVCKDQCLFSYYFIGYDRPFNLTIRLVLRDCDGNIVFTSFPITVVTGSVAPAVILIKQGLCQLLPILQMNGYGGDLSEVCSYDFIVQDTLGGPSNPPSSITYNVECCECKTEFLFKSPTTSLWQSIMGGCINNATYTTVRDVMKKCIPCDTVGQSQYQTLNVTKKNSFNVTIPANRINERLVSEFLLAKEVYWNFEGQLYEVVITTNNYLYGTKDCLQDFVLDFEIFECEV